MANLKLSPPWQIFASEVKELFKSDPLVHTVYNEDDQTIRLYVDDAVKAAALEVLLPAEKDFGNIKMKLLVIPANEERVNIPVDEDIWNIAFKDSKAFKFSYFVPNVLGGITYVVFRNTVVQFFTDNLADLNGMRSTLYEDIARDVFGDKIGVFYCTAAPDPVLPLPLPGFNSPSETLQNPLGEWP